MEPSGGVADENIAILCLKRCNCIKHNGGGICTLEGRPLELSRRCSVWASNAVNYGLLKELEI